MKRTSSIRTLVCTVILSVFSCLHAQAASSIIGYSTTWASASTIRYGLVTQINYAFLLPTSDGSGNLQPIIGPSGTTSDGVSNLQNVVDTAHSQGVTVYIAVGGGSTPPSTFDAICANSSTMTTFVNNLVDFLQTYNLDGIDIDWEYPTVGTSSTNYGTFMIQLANKLHRRGKKLSTTSIGASWAGDGIPSSVFPYLDSMGVMAYDYSATDVAPYSYAVSSLAYWSGRNFPASKTVLGVPFYGYGGTWASGVSYAQILALGASPYSDTFTTGGTTYTYNGISTIQEKESLVFADGLGGIMIWNLGQDASGQYSLLSAIDSYYASGFPAWVSGTNYTAGQEVLYSANGQSYICLYANPGYDPTISTYFWSPVWASGTNYTAGQVVFYTPNGQYYICKYDNPGYNPTISTYFWSPE